MGPASAGGAPQGGANVAGPSGWISSDADPCASSASESEEENTIEEEARVLKMFTILPLAFLVGLSPQCDS